MGLATKSCRPRRFAFLIFSSFLAPIAGAAQLQATARCEKTIYHEREPITLSLTLKNVGNRPILLKKPFHWNPTDSRTNVRVQVEREGKTIETTSHTFTGSFHMAGPKSILLRPNQTLELASIILVEHPNIGYRPHIKNDGAEYRYDGEPLKSGAYTIRLKYSFSDGEVLSNPIYLKIKVSTPHK
jgi:hypothetical protein